MRQLARSDVVIFALYAGLTLLFTYPLGFQIGDALPGLAPDTFQYYWNMDWTQRALFELQTNPLYSQQIYYPYGASLAYDTLVLGISFLTLPIQLAFGLPAAYTVATLAAFVLSSYTAYRLAYELVRQRAAAFVAGFIFGLAPYHFAHLAYGHLNLVSMQWLPLCALAAKKYFDHARAASFFLLFLALLWTALTEWYYALYTLSALALYAVFRLWREREWRAIVGLGAMGVLYVVALSPLLLPMLREANDWPGVFRGAEDARKFSADLFSYVTPSSFNPLFGKFSIDNHFEGGVAERTLFLGFTTLVLVTLALFARTMHHGDFWFWVGSGIFFFVLSLGPVLHIGGETQWGSRGEIPLPYAWLSQLPLASILFAVARSVGRFGVLTLLSCAMLAAYGVRQVSVWFPRIPSLLYASVACVLIGIEFFVAPIPTTPTAVPRVIRTLGNEPGAFAILNTPFDFKTGGEALYWQTFHHKPTLNGYVSRQLPFPMVEGTRAMRPMLLLADPSDILIAPDPPASQILERLNVRYIVLHKQWEPRAAARAQRWITNNFENPLPLFDNERVALYRVPKATLPPLLVSFAQGWYDPERLGDGGLWRWMQNDARLLLWAREAQTVSLKFDTSSFFQERRLEIWLNEKWVHSAGIPPDEPTQIVVPTVGLASGVNTLRFHSVEGEQAPASLEASADARALSISFSQIEIETQP